MNKRPSPNSHPPPPHLNKKNPFSWLITLGLLVINFAHLRVSTHLEGHRGDLNTLILRLFLVLRPFFLLFLIGNQEYIKDVKQKEGGTPQVHKRYTKNAKKTQTSTQNNLSLTNNQPINKI